LRVLGLRSAGPFQLNIVKFSAIFANIRTPISYTKIPAVVHYTDHISVSSFEIFSAALPLKLGPGRLIVEVSRSHTVAHTHSVRLLWTSDPLVTVAATYTTHNKHKRRTPMPSAGFEPAIPEIEPLQTYALVRTDSGTGSYEIIPHKYRIMRSAADIMGASNT
jgi:hypothetical protein